MDGEANLPAPLASASGFTKSNLIRPVNPEANLSREFTTSSSSSSFSSSSPPGLLRDVQAAFKRHRPIGMRQSNNIRPRRTLVPQTEAAKSSASYNGQSVDQNKAQDEDFGSQGHRVGDSSTQTAKPIPVRDNQVDASITLPSMSVTSTNTYEESMKPLDVQQDKPGSFNDKKGNYAVASSLVEPQQFPLVDGQKKVQFSLGNNPGSQEMEWDVSGRPGAVTALRHDLKNQNFEKGEADIGIRSDGPNSSLLTKRTVELQEQLHQFRNFLHGDLSHPMTQSSIVGSSCATTTLINSASAPMLNSMTSCSHTHQQTGTNIAVTSLGDCTANTQLRGQGTKVQTSNPSSRCTSRMSVDQTDIDVQALSISVGNQPEVEDKECGLAQVLKGCEPNKSDPPKDPSPIDDKSTKLKGNAGDAVEVQSQPCLPRNPSLDVKLEPSKSEKQDKVANGKPAHRKRSYDPELFFKVNGKLYQRLGKIGSGGSSEVHKVISSDCHIYALKKIKLKGRDYATAFGFCQEIEYLNKLKGKNNIIQLVDYEVTDKTLLREVMNGSVSNKDGRVKEDGYIYMVLEYGEIDLAHMLSQKWKEMDCANSTIDENWLRFYWQQILLAVNTIHEERIVHSDLKPANFLLVRGSLKLIDFGIAKAIMSDTTNIQRDSQVGTLSYMSPEAFMCNETDANGNTIKCGRPSDIWSLGCILYQMVYGRTPFSEYKTFWAKFKVITDPNHEITYEAVSNPWLIDLMKKCLAWDRNQRWRIPQLLQHPFLVPPIPPQLSSCQDQSCKLLQLLTESCSSNPKALMLCGQLQELLGDPDSAIVTQASRSRDLQQKLLCEMSNICLQLQEQLADRGENIR